MDLASQYRLLTQIQNNPLSFNKPYFPVGSGNYLKTVDPGNFYKAATFAPANANLENFIKNPTISNASTGKVKTLSSLVTPQTVSSKPSVAQSLGLNVAANPSWGMGPRKANVFDNISQAAAPTINSLKNNFGWSKNAGVKAFGKNLGKYATGANALLQGFDAVGNLGDLSDAQAETDSLLTDILRSSASNPLASSMLTSDQISMLNKIKRGTYDTEAGFGDVDLMGLLSSAGQGALTGGLMGGLPGALVGGIGGALNSNLERQAQDQGLINSQLEGLYQALIDAEQQYKAMRRPNFTGLGIKSQYQM